eukprot:CAMPEP_0114985244 /NCGR_PEP_ID=MMETSP0216-20121206/7742_1 /TAXON_ID=223996 /ORGANISM="Protocruzia adherens, Strain Boccale" /LENGTH=152 /DNA_ID=CAMNT_0002347505 /DNA_START=1601 /DNA_END=2059 /DNA_ORIENTATION=-
MDGILSLLSQTTSFGHFVSFGEGGVAVVDSLVKGTLTSLAESHSTGGEGTDIRLFASMNVVVFLQVLGKSELFAALITRVSLKLAMATGYVATQVVAVGEGLAAIIIRASVLPLLAALFRVGHSAVAVAVGAHLGVNIGNLARDVFSFGAHD